MEYWILILCLTLLHCFQVVSGGACWYSGGHRQCFYTLWYFWTGLFWAGFLFVGFIICICKHKQQRKNRIQGGRVLAQRPGNAAGTAGAGGTAGGGVQGKASAPPPYTAPSHLPPSYSSACNNPAYSDPGQYGVNQAGTPSSTGLYSSVDQVPAPQPAMAQST